MDRIRGEVKGRYHTNLDGYKVPAFSSVYHLAIGSHGNNVGSRPSPAAEGWSSLWSCVPLCIHLVGSNACKIVWRRGHYAKVLPCSFGWCIILFKLPFHLEQYWKSFLQSPNHAERKSNSAVDFHFCGHMQRTIADPVRLLAPCNSSMLRQARVKALRQLRSL